MNTIYLDFRFSDPEHELWALEEYNRILEQNLSVLKTQEENLLNKRVQEQGMSEEDARIEFQEHYHITEDILPRYFRGNTLITLWAIYESALHEFAKYIKKQQNITLAVNDFNGSTLTKFRKYYDHVLKFPLVTDEELWTKIEMLLVLRNAFAHGNGRKDAVSEDTWKKAKKWHDQKIGIVVDMNYITFTAQFIQEAILTVKSSLNDLIQRIKAVY